MVTLMSISVTIPFVPWPAGADSTRRPVEVPASGEVQALIRACSSRAPTGIRNRALIVVMWRCGLRVGEALALEPRDVDLDAGTLRVRHGKGDKSRTVGIDAAACGLLARWIDRRKALAHNGRRKLFCTLDGESLTSPMSGTCCAASR